MKRALAYLKGLLADPLFVRVCMVVWGGPFLVLGLVAGSQIRPSDGFEWFGLALLGALATYGAFLVYAGAFGSSSLVERSTNFMSEGADILGILFALAVAIVAVPVTLLLRAVLKRRRL